ncbi:polyphosphate kinase 2 [Xanthomonadaceae bacterium JHOS43]|nr:polyphosphate kinase 2 [Xanthomonadaceae bacterium JHOS43]MCX7563645.1 polyphosphate kinase 2 [Xanthomonadaceae bacterium XH05]
MKRKNYEDALKPLKAKLAGMGRWAKQRGERIVVLFEGRDTAGKSGAINAIADAMNPRQCHIVALPTPSERERGQWYFQRYVPYLPSAGEVVLFDRSWYNRAGVERVMGFCTEAQYRTFLCQAPEFERLLVDDGIRLFKYWLTVDQEEQEKRFAERAADPLKQWKLSPVDMQAREKYAEYGAARDAMLGATHSTHAPWTLVDFNDQRLGRLTLIDHLLRNVPEGEIPAQPQVLPPLSGPALKETFGGPLVPIPPYQAGDDR